MQSHDLHYLILNACANECQQGDHPAGHNLRMLEKGQLRFQGAGLFQVVTLSIFIAMVALEAGLI